MKFKERSFPGTTSKAVTEREVINRKLARNAAAEGFVLLKNEDAVLPLEEGKKIGLYGAGAVKTVKGGTGSGDVNERDCVSICQGLKDAGYVITSEPWLEAYSSLYDAARLKWKEEILGKLGEYGGDFFQAYSTTAFALPCGDPIAAPTARNDGADTAVFVLSRIAGENADRHDTPGDYFISEEEKGMLSQISQSYRDVILVINTGGLIDLAFTEDYENIKAILQFVQAGQEGGSALADVITGAVTPSGKLSDSWALTYADYPNAGSFSYKNGDTDIEKYEEGVYVGYRYFDTFDVPVRYCFGYGLSYTSFTSEVISIKTSDMGTANPMVHVKAMIKNIGDTFSGKEVIQIYVSCPQGKIHKEFRRLAGFQKTQLLKPGETEAVNISFPLYQLTSYDEEQAAWVLEGGTYGIWAGSSIEDAALAGSLYLEEDAVMIRCEHICERKHELKELTPDPEIIMEKEAAWQRMADQTKKAPIVLDGGQIITETITYTARKNTRPGRAGELAETLSEEQLIALATGDPGKGQGSALGSAGITVPGAAAETSDAAIGEPWNIAGIVLADGPAGLRLNRTYQVSNGEIVKEDFLKSFEGGFFAPESAAAGMTYYQYCTAIPVGTLLAQTWNTELIGRIGEMIGGEMELFGVTLWLAPGMNIHRNPLCGRNFEYYSEDPLLSGLMASAMTQGVQKVPGCGTAIKHFACNNQEDNRMGSDSVLSERALREIYLKGFEIAVKSAQPMSIMTSYNMINGVHAANSYDLCTKAARDEWGFAGAVMTDWTTTTHSTRGVCTASGCIRAGNDMIMPGTEGDREDIRRELQKGTLSIKELKWCIANTINLALCSNQYEGAVSYLEQL